MQRPDGLQLKGCMVKRNVVSSTSWLVWSFCLLVVGTSLCPSTLALSLEAVCKAQESVSSQQHVASVGHSSWFKLVSAASAPQDQPQVSATSRSPQHSAKWGSAFLSGGPVLQLGSFKRVIGFSPLRRKCRLSAPRMEDSDPKRRTGLIDWLRGGAKEMPGTGLLNWLRGGSQDFQRETNNAAKYRSRLKLGIQISKTVALLLSAATIGAVGFSLPFVWGTAESLSQSFWLTRIVFLRSLGLVYFVAFLVAFQQNQVLLGDNGLLPVGLYLDKIREKKGFPEQGMTWEMLKEVPTLLWLADSQNINPWLRGISGIGMAISFAVMVTGGSNVFLMLALWILYHSLVNVGQRWYGFGWESQLLETGFISIFMVPFFSLNPLPAGCPTSWVSIWAMRWLTFRIMIGAGMIKMRGDSCWRDLTAMCYHYETQPVPNPVSYYLHRTPLWFHKFETMMNHIIELVVPFFLVAPFRSVIVMGGLVQIMFQGVLIVSGNLSFLNWLTAIPPIMCLDDQFLAPLFSASTVARVVELNAQPWVPGVVNIIREGAYGAFAALVLWLSAPVIQNLFSPNQVMNTAFGSWRLVNTYGAFGSITRIREEVILKGTYDELWAAREPHWEEYEFKVKPGDIRRRPPVISPYHYRLDWLMWFLPFGDSRRHPWLYHLIGKLLVNDEGVTTLMSRNPFHDREPPKYIKADIYVYEYTEPSSPEAKKGNWWKRQKKGTYLAPMSLDSLESVFQQFEWAWPPDPRLEPEQPSKAKAE